MRNDIDKKLCRFFMVNQSSLMNWIFIENACFFLLKFKLLIDNYIKNRPEGVPKSQNNCFTFDHNLRWKNLMFYLLNYTRLQKGKYIINGNSDLYEILNFTSIDSNWPPKDQCTNICTRVINVCTHVLLQVRAFYRACVHFIASLHVYDYCAHYCVRIPKKFFRWSITI